MAFQQANRLHPGIYGRLTTGVLFGEEVKRGSATAHTQVECDLMGRDRMGLGEPCDGKQLHCVWSAAVD